MFPLLPQPPSGFYKQHLGHYHPHPTSTHHSARFHPYSAVYPGGFLPSYKNLLARTPNTSFSYALPLHENTGPGVIVSTDYYYKPSDDLKPASPSSVYSDKSSYSGSVDT